MRMTLPSGEVLEGTPLELKEFVNKTRTSEPEPTQKRTYTRRGRKGKSWTAEENAILKNHYDKAMSTLKRLLPGRTSHAIYVRKSSLGLTRKAQPTSVGSPIPTPSFVEKRKKFMNDRANYYMKKYVWPREKAFVQASMDWNNYDNRKVQITIPFIPGISEDSLDSLYALLQRAIKTRTIINKNAVSICCQRNKGNWTDESWIEFLAEFMNKSKDVSEYFGVANKWKVVQNGPRRDLVYGRKD